MRGIKVILQNRYNINLNNIEITCGHKNIITYLDVIIL